MSHKLLQINLANKITKFMKKKFLTIEFYDNADKQNDFIF